MNIEEMLKMQHEFDQRVIREKGLQGQDLTFKIVNELIVELGEFANEGRWFKYWSNNQEPRTFERDHCPDCLAKGYKRGNPPKDEVKGVHGFGNHWYYCERCAGHLVIDRNPLLGEYADALHVFLSLAILNGWQDYLYLSEDALNDLEEEGFIGGLSGAFLEMNYWLLKSIMEKDRDEKLERQIGLTKQQFCFKNAWFLFIAIGTIGFKFKFRQIEQAFIDKNKENHARLDGGY